MTSEIRTRAVAVLSEVFDVSISPEANPSRVEITNWDSLKHMELVLRLEEEFQIRFSMQQVAEINNLNDIINILEVK